MPQNHTGIGKLIRRDLAFQNRVVLQDQHYIVDGLLKASIPILGKLAEPG